MVLLADAIVRYSVVCYCKEYNRAEDFDIHNSQDSHSTTNILISGDEKRINRTKFPVVFWKRRAHREPSVAATECWILSNILIKGPRAYRPFRTFIFEGVPRTLPFNNEQTWRIFTCHTKGQTEETDRKGKSSERASKVFLSATAKHLSPALSL